MVAEQHQCICLVNGHSGQSSADGSIFLLDGLPLTARAAFTPGTAGAVAMSISAQNNFENNVGRAGSARTQSQPVGHPAPSTPVLPNEGEHMLSQLGMLQRIRLLYSAKSVMQHS